MRVCRWIARSPFSSAVAGAVLSVLTAAAPAAAAASTALRDRLLCPAELLVVRADARRHLEIEPTAPLARGLKNRIGVALATLPLTCRRYLAAPSVRVADEPGFIDRTRRLRALFEAGEWTPFLETLDALSAQAPFESAPFLHDREGDRDEREARGVYLQHCHGCHVAPGADSENPAERLDDMARNLPREEFLARMLLGVRGTPEIGLSNPLTASEIGAMTRFLLSESSVSGQ